MTTTGPNFIPPIVRSAMPKLRDSVQWYFTKIGQSATVYLGLKERDRWDTSRVVIIDGEFDGTMDPKPRNAGQFVAPWHAKSVNPRELIGWERPVTLSIRAVDPRNPDSEDAQVEATETLIEQTVQALQNAMYITPSGYPVPIGQNNVRWDGSKAVWVDPGTATQQTFGKEFLITFTYRCAIFDAAMFDQQVVGAPIQKEFQATPRAGAYASVASTRGPTAVISGLAFVEENYVGQNLTLSGASSSANNGSFPIRWILGPSSVVIANPSAVAPDANNGTLEWSVAPG